MGPREDQGNGVAKNKQDSKRLQNPVGSIERR